MNQQIKSYKKFASGLLIFTIILSLVTLSVYADDIANQGDENETTVNVSEEGLTDGSIHTFSLNEAQDYALKHNKQFEINDSIVKALEVKEEEVINSQARAKTAGFTTSANDVLLKKGHTLELTKYQLELAKKNNEKFKKGLFVTVQNNYYSLKSAMKKLEITQGINKYATDNLNTVELKYSMGLSSDLDILGAKSAKAKADAEQNSAKRDVTLNQMAFNRSIGLPVFSKVSLTDDIKVEKYDDVDLISKINEALQNRLEMFKVKKVFDLDSLFIKLYEEYYPQNTYAYRFAAANTQTAELYVSLAEDAVRQSVYKAYCNMVNDYEMIKVVEAYETQQKIYDVAVIKYNTGLEPNIEVTEVLNKLREAQLDKEKWILKYQLDKITFEQSYGIGIGDEQIPYKDPQGMQY